MVEILIGEKRVVLQKIGFGYRDKSEPVAFPNLSGLPQILSQKAHGKFFLQ